jgi:hypothetical protein
MRYLLLAAGAVLVLGLALRIFVSTPPADLAHRLRMTGGVVLMALGVGLLFLRQFMLGATLGMAGFMLLRREAALRGTGSSGQKSSVRSAGIEMMLDHDTGEMDGRVLAGRYSGMRLSDLNLGELRVVGEDLGADAEALRLLETYLDRAHPGWRDDVHGDRANRQSAAPGAGGMDTKEAYEILGLEPGAGEAEVREAHRRLMKQVHPDRGGSAALAAQINEAKDRILGKHRRR